jgi:hypothetical protein
MPWYQVEHLWVVEVVEEECTEEGEVVGKVTRWMMCMWKGRTMKKEEVTGVVNFLEGKNLNCEFSPKKLKQKKRLRTSDGVENQNTEMATSASSLEEGRRAQ